MANEIDAMTELPRQATIDPYRWPVVVGHSNDQGPR